jgi:hypothetical protein
MTCSNDLVSRSRQVRVYDVMRLTCLALAAVVLASCASATPQSEPVRVVMSEHQGWTIRVTPSPTRTGRRWRARVEVWPPDRHHERYSGIRLHFTESASQQSAVVQSAITEARRYIDASRTQEP